MAASTYTKFIFQLVSADNVDYQPASTREEGTKEFSSTTLQIRSREDILVPATGSTVTLAIGTEAVAGLYIKNTGAESILVKYTQNGNTNEQKIGEASTAGNGEWMFVPKVDSSTNITLETDAAGTSTAHVEIIHT